MFPMLNTHTHTHQQTGNNRNNEYRINFFFFFAINYHYLFICHENHFIGVKIQKSYFTRVRVCTRFKQLFVPIDILINNIDSFNPDRNINLLNPPLIHLRFYPVFGRN